MKGLNATFVYFLGGLLGFIAARFFLQAFPISEHPLLGAVLVVTSFVALGLSGARIRMLGKEMRSLREEKKTIAETRDAKSKFLSFASHEIRKPITAVRWALSALIQGKHGVLQEEQKELVTKILKEAEAIEGITETFLEFSKTELGVMEILLSPLKLGELAEQVRERIIANKIKSAGEKEVMLHYLSSVDKERTARVNRTSIQLIVENLVENAIHYTPPGGTVSVSLKSDRDNLIISVVDTGIGIPTEDQPKIFREFFRAENAKLFQEHGSGIGLYLCKKYVEGHGGKIAFVSEENKGAEFTVTIPLSAEGGEAELEKVLRKI